MTAPSFVHLRMHSEYDIAKGAARIGGAGGVVEQAAALRQPALALTDGGGLFGAVKFYRACRERGVKPIIGCELKVDEKHDTHLLLLVASAAGYVNLNRLLTKAYSEGNGIAHESWFDAARTEGLIALSGGGRGDIGRAIAQARLGQAAQRAKFWRERFPDRFYVEVWRENAEDSNHAAAAADIAHRLDLPLAATHPVQCTKAGDEELLNIKMCIASGHRTSDAQRPRPLSDSPHLLSAEEMRERFADMPAALDNSAELAKRCNFAFDFGSTHLPTLPRQEVSSGGLLRSEAAAGLARKVADAGAEGAYQQRLDYELAMIEKMGFADYFLIVMDFIRWAKENGIPVGPGRGSGAGSLVAYVLDITTLDPIRHELLFERFLNPERVSMPDFDVDFCVNGRDQVIRYVEERYGRARVAQIVTLGTIGAKGAIRDVGRVLGLPYNQCDRVARMIPDGLNMTIARALQESPEFAEQRRDEDLQRLIDLAGKAEGLPRNIGTHAGGVLIAPQPLEEFCPLYAAPDTATLVSQFDMLDIEKIGLVKFDFLGLRTLTILADAERAVRETQPEFDLDKMPMDDAATYALYSSGRTLGVFQCDSPGMRELMRHLKPDRFSDLVALVALYRPGPLNAGMDASYIKRKHGKEEVDFPHASLAPVLEDTYGLFIYQEQVMEIARRIAGYSLGQADILRRAMGKKDTAQMAEMEKSFVQGSAGTLARGAAIKLFKDMAQFAEYGFNKSHAAAYALLSYRTAHLKAHHPAIFLAAVLSAEADSGKRVHALVKDAEKFGVNTHAPDINEDGADFRAVDARTVRYGLRGIKGVGSGHVEAILNLRKEGGAFKDVFDFCRRIGKLEGNMPISVPEALTRAGAFDRLHDNRAAVMATLPSAMIQDTTSGNLFAVAEGAQEELAPAAPWTLREQLHHEKLAFGFPFSKSYYALYEDILPQLPLDFRQLENVLAAEKVTVAGSLLRLRRRAGKNGDTSTFVLGDDSGEVEVLVPRQQLKQLTGGEEIAAELVVVRGRAFADFRGGISIAAAQVWRLDAFLAEQLRRVRVACDEALDAPALALALRAKEKARARALLRCTADGVTYDVDLLGGAHCELSHARFQALRGVAGVQEVILEFAPP